MLNLETIRRGNWIPKIVTPALLILLLTQAVKVTSYMSDINSRTLSTVEMRVRLEDHMESWTPVRQEKAFERLRSTEIGIIELRKEDSLSAVDRKEMK